MGMHLFEIEHPELQEIWHEIEESDGVITPEQEVRITEIMADQLGVVSNAAKAKEMEVNAEQLREWVRQAQIRYRLWEETASRIRAAILEALKELLPDAHKPNGKKSILGQRGALRVGLRQNNKGKVEHMDGALEETHTIRGYESEQVFNSQLQSKYFEAKTIYVLNTDKLAEDLKLAEGLEGEDRPKGLGLARMDYEPSVVITLLGGKVSSAADKSREAAREVARGEATSA